MKHSCCEQLSCIIIFLINLSFVCKTIKVASGLDFRGIQFQPKPPLTWSAAPPISFLRGDVAPGNFPGWLDKLPCQLSLKNNKSRRQRLGRGLIRWPTQLACVIQLSQGNSVRDRETAGSVAPLVRILGRKTREEKGSGEAGLWLCIDRGPCRGGRWGRRRRHWPRTRSSSASSSSSPSRLTAGCPTLGGQFCFRFRPLVIWRPLPGFNCAGFRIVWHELSNSLKNGTFSFWDLRVGLVDLAKWGRIWGG